MVQQRPGMSGQKPCWLVGKKFANQEFIELDIRVVAVAAGRNCVPAESQQRDHEGQQSTGLNHWDKHRLGPALAGDLLPFLFEGIPSRIESRSFGLKFVVNADDFLAGLGVGFDKLMGAAGDFLIEIGHGRVLLGLAVGGFASDLSSSIVTAAGQDHEYDPADPYKCVPFWKHEPSIGKELF